MKAIVGIGIFIWMNVLREARRTTCRGDIRSTTIGRPARRRTRRARGGQPGEVERSAASVRSSSVGPGLLQAGRRARPPCAASGPGPRSTSSTIPRSSGFFRARSPSAAPSPPAIRKHRHDDARRPRQDHAAGRQRRSGSSACVAGRAKQRRDLLLGLGRVRVVRAAPARASARIRPCPRGTATRPSASRRTSGTARGVTSEKMPPPMSVIGQRTGPAARRCGWWRRSTGRRRTTRRRRPGPARPPASAARCTCTLTMYSGIRHDRNGSWCPHMTLIVSAGMSGDAVERQDRHAQPAVADRRRVGDQAQDRGQERREAEADQDRPADGDRRAGPGRPFQERAEAEADQDRLDAGVAAEARRPTGG